MEEKQKCKSLRLFVLNYTVSTNGNNYAGCAVVKSDGVKHATSTFLKDSYFNGTSNKIKVGMVREIYPSPDSMLICEEYTKDAIKEITKAVGECSEDAKIIKNDLNTEVAPALEGNAHALSVLTRAKIMLGEIYATLHNISI